MGPVRGGRPGPGLGNGLLALLRQPDQRRRLAAEPDLAGSAVEELLRYDAPVQLTARIATEDLDVGGAKVSEDDAVTCVLAAGKRDPRYVEEPDRLVLARGRPTHLSFSAGIHHGLGAPLARLEAQVVLPSWPAAFRAWSWRRIPRPTGTTSSYAGWPRYPCTSRTEGLPPLAGFRPPGHTLPERRTPWCLAPV